MQRINRVGALSSACLLALLTMVPRVAAQTVYRWTDERGVLHFGHLPPPNRGAEERHLPQRSRAEAPEAEETPPAEPANDDATPQPPAAAEPNVMRDADGAYAVRLQRSRFERGTRTGVRACWS